MGKLISSDCNRRSEREDGAGGGLGGGVCTATIRRHNKARFAIDNNIQYNTTPAGDAICWCCV